MDTFLRSFPRMYTMASCPRPVSQVFLLDTITGHNLRRFGFKWTQFQVILGGSRIYFASHKVLFLDTLLCCFCTQSRVGAPHTPCAGSKRRRMGFRRRVVLRNTLACALGR